ncbi:hypothetical protein [Gimesia alba]|uniref:hypothetical protein n=1 Tax=Gimesia alba TaxID=2527973 RepID=UPI0011A429B7|nr:hypothetical protein [Gimesia alba]
MVETGLSSRQFDGFQFLYSLIIMENDKKTTPAKVSNATNKVKEAKQPPICRVEFSGISAAVWPKQIPSVDGQSRETWMVSLTRSYRDGNETKRTHVLFPEHLLPASMALIKAWEFIENGGKAEEQNDA